MTVKEHLLESMASIADEESRMKSYRHGERMHPGICFDISIPPEVSHLLGYKTEEKKDAG